MGYNYQATPQAPYRKFHTGSDVIETFNVGFVGTDTVMAGKFNCAVGEMVNELIFCAANGDSVADIDRKFRAAIYDSSGNKVAYTEKSGTYTLPKCVVSGADGYVYPQWITLKLTQGYRLTTGNDYYLAVCCDNFTNVQFLTKLSTTFDTYCNTVSDPFNNGFPDTIVLFILIQRILAIFTSNFNTAYRRVEPVTGFGDIDFGDTIDGDKEFISKGFGDPETVYTITTED